MKQQQNTNTREIIIFHIYTFAVSQFRHYALVCMPFSGTINH